MFKSQNIFLSKVELLIVVTLVTAVIAFSDQVFLLFAPLLIFIFLLATKFSKQVIFPLVFFLLMAFPSSLGEDLRLIIQLASFSIAFIFFLYLKGLDYKIYPRFSSKLMGIIAIYFLSILISTFFSSYIFAAIPQLLRTLQFFILIYLLAGMLEDENDAKTFINTFYIITFYYSALLFYELFRMNFDLVSFNKDLILYDDQFLFHKNHLGLLFSITILLLITKLFNDRVSPKSKAGYSFILLIMFFALIITNSRGALVALLFAIGFLIFYLQRKYLKYYLTAVSATILLVLIGPFGENLDYLLRLESVFTGRDLITDSIFKVISENIIFGAGPSATRFEIYKDIPFMLDSPEGSFLKLYISRQEFGHAHNFFLFLFSDLGILGLLTSLYFPVVYFKLGFGSIKKMNAKSEDYYMVVGLISIGVMIFIRGLFEWGNILSYGMISADLPFWCVLLILNFYYSKNVTKSEM